MLRALLGRITMAAGGLSLCASPLAGTAPSLHFAVSGALAALLAVAVRWGPRRHIAAAALLAGGAMASWLWFLAADLPIVERLAAALVWTAPAGMALVAGGYPRLTAHQRAVEVEQARQELRLRWARDLHDFVAHDVSGIVAQAQAARFVAPGRPEAAGAALERIEAAGLAALATMDRMVGMLHEPDGPAVRPVPTLVDLPGLVDRFRAGGDADVRFTEDPRPVRAPRDTGAVAYRVVTEALTNVRRHAASARRVDVSVTGGPTGVEVRIRDDGPGATPPQRRSPGAGGRGLAALREQVSAVGGTLTAGPADRGWEVVAVFPGGGS
ncbi:sensor histidine kinase [Actinoplanes lobatus]|nr:histidine kinase [Actinoplanes lobatus]MBB4753698.1 signal transduction histidine kinase [Actinoplanes lobatus]